MGLLAAARGRAVAALLAASLPTALGCGGSGSFSPADHLDRRPFAPGEIVVFKAGPFHCVSEDVHVLHRLRDFAAANDQAGFDEFRRKKQVVVPAAGTRFRVIRRLEGSGLMYEVRVTDPDPRGDPAPRPNQLLYGYRDVFEHPEPPGPGSPR